MTRLIGLEKEYFVVDKQGKVVAPRIAILFPMDDCGFLAEARGKPSEDIYQAVTNLLAEEWKIQATVNKINALKWNCFGDKELEILIQETIPIALVEVPTMNFRMKDVLKFYNADMIAKKENIGSLDGKTTSSAVTKKTAGLHIHFSGHSDTMIEHPSDRSFIKTITRSYFLDMPSIIHQLDNAFKEEIKKSKRPFGVYRMKTYSKGKEGFEYRSLPNNIDLKKLITVLKELK